jgi:hypothetical protein
LLAVLVRKSTNTHAEAAAGFGDMMSKAADMAKAAQAAAPAPAPAAVPAPPKAAAPPAPAPPAPPAPKVRQHLYFCTSEASKTKHFDPKVLPSASKHSLAIALALSRAHARSLSQFLSLRPQHRLRWRRGRHPEELR